ncbi:translation initiation factor IF-2-like [Amphibalanus amphitrite]|uniref:translation initiation factor IF-2-like n=1 Tax=Amphibalanus amphitrite TaxID=1232801 RepID=UPI001C9113FC|nr:translation initiation factor IF-2-like [Amphibalanus amphitrite]
MKAIFGVLCVATTGLAATLPSSYAPPATQPVASAPVRAQESYVPPATQSQPATVQESYVPPATEPAAQSVAQPAANTPVRVQESYVPPATQVVSQPAANAPVRAQESYVPPQPASPEVVFPPDGERAPWHPDPRQKPSQPLVVSGSAPQPGAGYVPPAPAAPSAPLETYVPPTVPTQPPQQSYVPPAY